MNNKLFRFISLLWLVFISTNLLAQTNSPYSQFGIGDITMSGFGQNKAMGGMGIAYKSNEHLNNINPASYTALDSLSVIYELGLSSEFNYIESELGNTMKTNANMDYLSLAFRLNKFWYSSFGLTPVSEVDYAFMASEQNDILGEVDTYYYGSGGLSQIYLGNAFKLSERLSIGVHATYVFGAINKINTKVFEDLRAYNTKQDNKINIYGLKFNYGVQYTHPINEDYSLTFGAIYENKIKLNTKTDILAGSIRNNTTIDESYYSDLHYKELIDTIYQVNEQKSDMTYPSSYGFGLAFTNKDKLAAGLDVKIQNWSEIDLESDTEYLKDLYSINGGFEYTPDKNNINSYFKRVRYRFGGHFTQTHLNLKNEQINDYGISFGAGLPLRNSKTSFNLTFEFGQRGTLNENLLRETYGIISLNLSLSDIWFVKRKFN